jgi:hypothetical protein
MELSAATYPLNYKHEDYPEIREHRRPDRAKVWLVSAAELLSIEPELANLWPEHLTLDQVSLTGIDKRDVFKQIACLLRRREPDLQRGDMVYLEPELGYRNDGIYIYDGRTMVSLTTDIIDYGHIPAEFEVISEFPIHYWEGRNHHNDLVPFDMAINFAGINMDEIQGIQADIFRPYFYFETDEGEGYYIVAEYYEASTQRPSREALYRAFLQQLNRARFFETSPHENEDFDPVSIETDEDHVLYLNLDLDGYQEDPGNYNKA